MKLNKKGKMLATILAILFITYNVILFILSGFTDHTAVFWLSWAFMMISFGAMACVGLILGKQGMFLRDWLFGYPIIRHTTLYLVFEFVASTIFIIFEQQVGLGWTFSLQFLFLAVYLVFAISCFMAKETISDIHTKVSDKTRFIKMLRADAEMLTEKCADAETKEQCQQLAEAIRYSDPMSSKALFELEKELALAVSECDKAVAANDFESARKLCEKAMLLLAERNKKCKTLKA